MSPAAAFVASSAPELAEDLWVYYFERSLDLPMAPSLEAMEAVRRSEAVLDPTPDLHLHFATQQQVYDRMREAQACLDTRDFLGARLAAEAALQDANVLIAPALSRLYTLHGAACAGLVDRHAARAAFEEAIRQAGGSPVIPAGQDFPDPLATVFPRLALARLWLDRQALAAAEQCLHAALASCERALDDARSRSVASVSQAEGLSLLVALTRARDNPLWPCKRLSVPGSAEPLPGQGPRPDGAHPGRARGRCATTTRCRRHGRWSTMGSGWRNSMCTAMISTSSRRSSSSNGWTTISPSGAFRLAHLACGQGLPCRYPRLL
jgi:hypothetical protein